MQSASLKQEAPGLDSGVSSRQQIGHAGIFLLVKYVVPLVLFVVVVLQLFADLNLEAW